MYNPFLHQFRQEKNRPQASALSIETRGEAFLQQSENGFLVVGRYKHIP